MPGSSRAEYENSCARRQARGEELDAVIVFLDAIEAPASPPVAGLLVIRPFRFARDIGRSRAEPAVDGVESSGQGSGEGDEPPLLRQRDRQRNAHEIARCERGPNGAVAVLDVCFVAPVDANALIAGRQRLVLAN